MQRLSKENKQLMSWVTTEIEQYAKGWWQVIFKGSLWYGEMDG